MTMRERREDIQQQDRGERKMTTTTIEEIEKMTTRERREEQERGVRKDNNEREDIGKMPPTGERKLERQQWQQERREDRR